MIVWIFVVMIVLILLYFIVCFNGDVLFVVLLISDIIYKDFEGVIFVEFFNVMVILILVMMVV